MSTAVREPQQGVFGNLTVPRHSGLFGLSLLQSAGLVPLVLLFIALIASGRFLVAMVLVAFTCLVILLMKIKVRDGRTVFGRVAVRWSQSRMKRRRRTSTWPVPPGPAPRTAQRACPDSWPARSCLSTWTPTVGPSA